MTWLEEIVLAFEKLGGEAHVQDVYAQIEKDSPRQLAIHWRSTIRKEIETNSSDSEAFLHKRDLFESVNGINQGVWRLREFSTPPIVQDLEYITGGVKFPNKQRIEIFRIIRDTKIIKGLKALYENKCQVCGLSIKINRSNGLHHYSEGHHIQPLGINHNGSDTRDNILILCANHHVEFDYLNIAVDPKTLTIIHYDSDNIYNRKKLLLRHTLNPDYLRYHFIRFTNT